MAGEEGMNAAQMKGYLVPAVAAAAVVVLAGLVIYVSGGTGRKMSDGSNGSADDSGLKEAVPGVKYRDIKEGLGDECPAGAAVTMHYTGWLDDGTVFDSSKDRGTPLDAVLKPGTKRSVIEGWNKGVPGMKKGGVRKLVIAPEKGYGERGSGKIPPNSTLIFEVELVDFTPGPLPRRAAPSDLTKLSDGTGPGADDPGLKPIGSGGVKYRDLKVGDGPVCPEGATPIMDYIGWLTTGGQPFDTNFKGPDPLDMPLAKLIVGWQQGVPGMKVGGIRKLVIPADLAYGSTARPGIPANSVLVFEVELLGLK